MPNEILLPLFLVAALVHCPSSRSGGDGGVLGGEMLFKLLYQAGRSESSSPSYKYTYSSGASVYSFWHAAGTAIPSASPILNFTATAFSATPALPAGIVLNSSTGVFSGTPVGASALTSYSLQASGGGVSVSTGVRFGVDATAANVTCNNSGVAPGCTAGLPFACPGSGTICYATQNECRASRYCSNYL